MSFTPNADSAPEANAKVVAGTYEEAHSAFVGMTVAQVRLARSEAFNIASDAKAYRGREEVNEDYVLRRGDQIEFVRRQGDKG